MSKYLLLHEMPKWRLINLLKLTLILVLAVICFIVVCHFELHDANKDIYEGVPKILPADKETARLTVDERIKKLSSREECLQPNLAVAAPEIMKFIFDTPPANCNSVETDWVECESTACHIKYEIKAKLGPVSCSFSDIHRFSDYTNKKTSYSETGISYNLKESDVVHVSCRSLKQAWSNVLTGIRLDYDAWKYSNWNNVSDNGLKMNVLIFGLDSLSRNAFIRKLPKTYKYLTRELNGLVLQGYNVVGAGTSHAITPMLTGKTELELPDTRKRFEDTEYVDVYPFVWNEFQNFGYVTAFFEDSPQRGTYNHRLRGFENVPTNHYMRPYYLAIEDLKHRWPNLCVGSVPRHKIMMNHILDFFFVYKSKPKFLFGFLGDLSHNDYNSIGGIDDDFIAFLKSLKKSEALQNTMLIIMSDHGHRFGKIPETIQGKQEARLPFLSFRFPTWFKNYHRNFYDNFVTNSKRLTTPFDIHTTLRTVLDMYYKDDSNRSMSLFKVVPETRSCADAYIEPHWCTCLEWETINATAPIVGRLIENVIKAINDYTSAYRNLCSKLQFSKLVWVYKLNPNENLIRFRESADVDGFHPDMSSNMTVEKEIYQVRLLLRPGYSLFEATIEYYLQDDVIISRIDHIKRVNKYGKYSQCVKRDYQLRKYCYCLMK